MIQKEYSLSKQGAGGLILTPLPGRLPCEITVHFCNLASRFPLLLDLSSLPPSHQQSYAKTPVTNRPGPTQQVGPRPGAKRLPLQEHGVSAPKRLCTHVRPARREAARLGRISPKKGSLVVAGAPAGGCQPRNLARGQSAQFPRHSEASRPNAAVHQQGPRSLSAPVKCQGFNLKNKSRELGSDVPGGRSIQIELVLYNRRSHGNILLKGKKVTAASGNSSSKLVLTSVGMGSTLTIHSNGTFLCFNKLGRLVNKRRLSRRKKLCEFREEMRDHYSIFQSLHNKNWYIGFNRLGQPIRARNVPPRKWLSFMFLKRQWPKDGRTPQPFDEVSQKVWDKLLKGAHS
ncbi:hypothetical protein HPB48_002084 [Haemaphysalis longicornis]|uniref:Uncharacterized protein n=1 Tax=Haemaphysalis longicornis TaxID=44386 RepID=A0A9J6FG69_HAELO|nr:hypothetical protein HPB48_002084 [Haemaphysalis longicornis]